MLGRLISWLASLGGLFRRARAERDLADEADFHLRARTEHWVRQGLPPHEAARRARIEFGGVESYKDIGREIKGFRFFDDLCADLRYGWRQLRAAPALSFVAIAILAIGIGANTAVFSVLEATLWRPLPVERPEALREIVRQMQYTKGVDFVAATFMYPVFSELRDRSTSFSDVFLFDRHEHLNLSIQGRASLAPGLAVSGNFLRGLGVRMAHGRSFTPDDDRVDAPAVAVLTHRGWRRLFGGDPSAIGARITLNGATATVIGITAPAFEGIEPGKPIEVMAPLMPLGRAFDPDGRPFTDVDREQYRLMGRLKDGVSDEQARGETILLAQQAATRGGSPDAARFATIVLRDGSQGLDSLRVDYGPQLRLMLGLAAAVLLVACANVAGLLLTRAAARRREMSVRLALGAGRGRLIRQTFTEALLLAALGSAAGLGLALGLRDRLLPLLNQGTVPLDLTLTTNWRLLLFSLALCAGVGSLCGLLPALRLTRQHPRPSLTRGAVGSAAGAPRLLAGKALIALQLGLSIVLLASAGLMVRTLGNLRSEPLGFESSQVALFTVNAALSRYEGTRLLDFYDRVRDKIAAVPGVRSASLSRYALLKGEARLVATASAGGAALIRHLNMIGPRYFETMGIPLRQGREFTAADREDAPKTAIVNEAFARTFGVTIGRRIAYPPGRPADTEVIGIVADARYTSARTAAPLTIYLPFRQRPSPQMTVAARASGDAASLLPHLRQALAELDPLTPPFDMTTQAEQNDRSWRKERVFAGAVTVAALLAVVLACLGVYGTLSYSVARRTPEIGVRIALGAHPADVVRLVAGESAVAMAIGTLAGCAGAMFATRFIEHLLFGVTRLDVPTFAGAGAVIAATAAMAAWLPSRRAARVDPVIALRRE